MFTKSRRIRFVALSVIAALVALISQKTRCCGQANLMPATAGRTLAGNTVQLPEGTRGKPLVLIFSFQQSAKGQSEEWGRQLLQWRNEEDGFSFYQVAMLSGAPRFVRGLIVHAIRDAVPEIYRDHMLVLSSNEEPWQTVLEPKGKDSVSVVYCDGTGHILWQSIGASTEQFDELHSLLRKGAM